MKAASTTESINHLMNMLDEHTRVYYVRFGDGEIMIMNGRSESHHTQSTKLKKEVRASFKIKDHEYIKAAVLGYPEEPGMCDRMFIDGTANHTRCKMLTRWTQRFTDETYFYNPIVFHYLSIHNPSLLRDFIYYYIRPQTKMFIGGNSKAAMEKLYGKIDHYIETPKREAYYAIDEWWPEVERNVGKCQVVLPSAGVASEVVAKRLWNLNADIHCIDIGSINDIVEGNASRGWIKRMGLEKLQENLLGAN